MSAWRVSFILASLALGVALVGIVVRVGHIDVAATAHQVESAKHFAIFKLLLLNILLATLSTEKWRSVDSALRHSQDAVPSWASAFATTSFGIALGFVLPTQLGMAAARTVGTSFYGRPLKRGTAGSLFEQSFDLLLIIFLCSASVITWFCGGGPFIWTISAVVACVVGLTAVGPAMRVIRLIAGYLSQRIGPDHRIGKNLKNMAELEDSGVFSSTLARRLMMFSAIRFAVVVLMANQTAEAVGAGIAVWQLGAAIPFVVLATAIAFTPGALGVNELTYAATLKLFGAPFTVAAQWTLTNRVLLMFTSFLLAWLALGAVFAHNLLLRKSNGATGAKGVYPTSRT